MLKLTTIHIEEIRKYFLATNEEEQLIIQKNIRPSDLSNFLPKIKNLFNSKVSDLSKLSSVAKSMGAEDHLKVLKEIQQDYYSHLAEQYNSGALNPDIKLLIEVQNRDFLQEVEFQKELKTAFQLNERASLKKKFQQLDKESDIDTDEMSQAFKLIERQKLKEQFQNIEYEAEIENIGMVAEPAAHYSGNKKFPSLNSGATVIPFNWKPLAIAASLIGLVLTTTFIIFKANKKQFDVVINKPNPKKTNMDSDKKQSNVMVAIDTYINLFPSDEKQLKVLKEQSFGFVSKDEYVNVQTFYLADSLKAWKEIEKNDPLKRKIISSGIVDSLNNFRNKYHFKRDTIEIYLLEKQAVKLFEINAEKYLQIGKVIYECKKFEKLLPLKKVTDKKTLETIDKIIFNESN